MEWRPVFCDVMFKLHDHYVINDKSLAQVHEQSSLDGLWLPHICTCDKQDLSYSTVISYHAA